jgi:hypothetical protein
MGTYRTQIVPVTIELQVFQNDEKDQYETGLCAWGKKIRTPRWRLSISLKDLLN